MKKTIAIALAGLIISICFFVNSVSSENNINIIIDITEQGIDPESEIPINTEFIYSIQENLSTIIFDYFRGREFGTPGEREAARRLKESWDEHIAKNNSDIPDAELDPIDNALLNNRIGFKSQDDYFLKLSFNGEEKQIPDTECHPVPPALLFGSVHEIQNAEIIITPDFLYNPKSNIMQKNNSVNITNSYDNNKSYVYLIEMKKLEDHGVKWYHWDSLLFKLIRFTKSNKKYPTPDGFICADYTKDAHWCSRISSTFGVLRIPGMMINGSLGEKIRKEIEENNDGNVTADIEICLHSFRDIESYNVIGTIPGVSKKIVIVSAHYDGWWGQCSGDDTASVSIVWAIAKYFSDNNIKPYYTLKFAAWAGEEYGCRGSKNYVQKNRFKQQIKYSITLGAVGYRNNSGYTKEQTALHVSHMGKSPFGLMRKLREYNYTEESGGYGGIDTRVIAKETFLLDTGSFIGLARGIFSFEYGDVDTIGLAWHRDGENHTAGNTIDLIDQKSTLACAKIILETVKQCSEKPRLLSIFDFRCWV